MTNTYSWLSRKCIVANNISDDIGVLRMYVYHNVRIPYYASKSPLLHSQSYVATYLFEVSCYQ